jgi:hypothetical protein
MSRIQQLNQTYEYAGTAVQHVAIHDELLHAFSGAVRRLNWEMRDWLDVSTDWDKTLAYLRRADWRLRNQPGIFDDRHSGKVHLKSGLDALERLGQSSDSGVQKLSRLVSENGHAILAATESTLNSNLVSLIKESQRIGAQRPLVVVRQEDLVSSTSELLASQFLDSVIVTTGFKAVQKRSDIDKLFVVGNSQDYSASLFTAVFSEFGTTLLGYEWVPERDQIGTSLHEIASKPLTIEVQHSTSIGMTEAVDISHFLEPSTDISSRRLKSIAEGIYSRIQSPELDEDVIPCKAYLLAGDHLVFLPTKAGALDCIDLTASEGNRVQRFPISSLGIGSVILLRVGKSDSESIIEMANQIGGADARVFRKLQMEWKEQLRIRMAMLGSPVVIKQLQNLGIPNPWLGEWKSVKNNIRPDRDDYFRILLDYLGIEPNETMAAMNGLRRLHRVAAMRLRKMLKEKFENADLQPIHDYGLLIEDLGETQEIAKLGAFVCLSIGDEVFEVPESSVKHLQRTSG